MKNFRKVLALVLVVATLFSFAAMASAATYKDADKVSYKEAVDVLSALNILNGYPEDGTFRPTNSITREEMAKMIATLANAGDDVSKLYANTCEFADVAKDRWSASYVAYCNKTGIVAGRSATTFDPLGKVTGLETAKMLLVTLGFDAKVQGYIGADWKINVLRDAKNFGLLDNFAKGYNPDAAITREEAANMMLNTLKANVVVGVLSENIVKVTNALYNDYKTVTLPDAQKYGWTVMYKNVIVANHTLFEGLYGGKLTQTSATGFDCQGRPGSQWLWTDDKGHTTVLSSYAGDPFFTSHNTNAKEVEKKIAAYEGTQKVAKEDIHYFIDGKYVGTSVNDNVYGKGVQVELYLEPMYKDGKFVENHVIVVIVNTFLGTVKNVDTNKDRVAIEVNGETFVGANTYGFKHADEGTVVLFEKCNEHKAHEWNDAKKYTAALHSLEVAKPVEIKLHGFWNDQKGNLINFCDGNKNYYEAAHNATLNLKDDMLGGTYNLYLDKFGYAKALTEVTEAAKVTVIVDGSGRQFNKVLDSNGAAHYDYTGRFVEFENNPTESKDVNIDEGMFKAEDQNKVDRLVKYVVDANGTRVLTGEAPTILSGEYELNKESGMITGLNGVYGNNNTKYLLRVFNSTTGKYDYKFFDGKNAIDNNYVLTNLQYFTEGSNTHNGSAYLTYVYAHATYAAASQMAFVTEFKSHESYLTEGNVNVKCDLYHGFVDGKEALIAFEQGTFNTTDTPVGKVWEASYQLISTESHNKLPIYMARMNDVHESVGKDFVANNGVLEFISGSNIEYKDLANDAKITVLVEKDGKTTVAAQTADELINFVTAHNHEQMYGWYKTENGKVTVLYVLVKDDADQGGWIK